MQAANGDIAKAEKGIIFIDEIDKKSKRGENVSISRDVSGEGVQQALLKIIEGSDVRISLQGNRKHPQAEMIAVNTRNILFITGGAFVGLNEIITNRINKDSNNIGFGSNILNTADSTKDTSKYLSQVEPEDLIKYGLIPELVGRLPIITHLEELTNEQLISVLIQPKNAIIKQFTKMFKLENIDLEFDKDALEAIAKLAIARKTGARGLRSVIEKKLTMIQFKLADFRKNGITKIRINKEVINGELEPILIKDSDDPLSDLAA